MSEAHAAIHLLIMYHQQHVLQDGTPIRADARQSATEGERFKLAVRGLGASMQCVSGLRVRYMYHTAAIREDTI